MQRAYYVAASGTDAGKTLVTAGLCWQLRNMGRAVQALKPVISGFDATQPELSDSGVLLAAQQCPVTWEAIKRISPWRFAAPVSPHLAVRQHAEEGGAVRNATGEAAENYTAEHIIAFCRQAIGEYNGVTLIEGAGGAFTPLLQGFTQADLLQQLDIPVVLVAGNYLGSISHTLATAEALLARGVMLQALVISGSEAHAAAVEEVRDAVLVHLPKTVQAFTLPRISPKTDAPLWQQLPPLTEVLTYDP